MIKKQLKDYNMKERSPFEQFRNHLIFLALVTTMISCIVSFKNMSMTLFFLLIAIVHVGVQFILCHFLEKKETEKLNGWMLMSISFTLICLYEYLGGEYLMNHYGVEILIYTTSFLTLMILFLLSYLKVYPLNRTIQILTIVLVIHCPWYVNVIDVQYQAGTVKQIIEVNDYSFIAIEENDNRYIVNSQNQELLSDIVKNSSILIKYRNAYRESHRKAVIDIENTRETATGIITYLYRNKDDDVIYIKLDHQEDVYSLELDGSISTYQLEEGKRVKLEYRKREEIRKIENLLIEEELQEDAL